MRGVLKVVAWLTETKDESQSPNRNYTKEENDDVLINQETVKINNLSHHLVSYKSPTGIRYFPVCFVVLLVQKLDLCQPGAMRPLRGYTICLLSH